MRVVLYADRVGGFIDALATQPDVAANLDVSGVRAARDHWNTAASALEASLATTLASSPSAVRTQRLAAMNEAMRSVEQALLNAEGIPGRPWFRHVLYAPRYTYAAMTLPGVQEAIEARDWARARVQLAIVTARLDSAAAATRRAADAARPR